MDDERRRQHTRSARPAKHFGRCPRRLPADRDRRRQWLHGYRFGANCREHGTAAGRGRAHRDPQLRARRMGRGRSQCHFARARVLLFVARWLLFAHCVHADDACRSARHLSADRDQQPDRLPGYRPGDDPGRSGYAGCRSGPGRNADLRQSHAGARRRQLYHGAVHIVHLVCLRRIGRRRRPVADRRFARHLLSGRGKWRKPLCRYGLRRSRSGCFAADGRSGPGSVPRLPVGRSAARREQFFHRGRHQLSMDHHRRQHSGRSQPAGHYRRSGGLVHPDGARYRQRLPVGRFGAGVSRYRSLYSASKCRRRRPDQLL